MSIKYNHSKSPKSYQASEKKKASRKASKHKSIEYIYGTHYPKMGGSLGVSYNKSTGAISKEHRADSVA
jgi:hypothetical protein